ncbi:GspE/PulE family protein [Desulfoferrobacter suflitae]|uniref:GspE/PulE family protein n=1 Tax=Desulfoferrobacter suflitae TaxID=2865782 RepID=UPI00216453B0|nr:ATPase, T2SS/T4P/T4SS family [Desulfoferrobacter suflitae]MCK8600699.1 Flp pilus assembly complex ATPase component TadA [Desulfoferrobacter suflitae]
MDSSLPLIETFRNQLGLIDKQVEQLRTSYFVEGLPLIEAFERIEFTDEGKILSVLSEYLDLPLLDREDYPDKPVLLEDVSMSFLRKHSILPIQIESGRVRVVINNPMNFSLLEILGNYFSGMEISLCLGQREEIRTSIDRLYGAAVREAEALSRNGEGLVVNADPFEEDLEHLRGLAQEAPIVRLVNVLISRALDMRASDIHFEPFERSFQVRCRVDGVLFDLDQPPKTMQPAIISRLKLMANLNIAERRLPQDGKIKLRFGNREVDIRVSSVPTIYGESIVLRLLAQDNVEYKLDTLGMDDQQLVLLKEMIERPFGMILVTGPTGSGKTTTLYGVLKRLNSVERKILTVEDPVEYQINGINQIQVKPQIDLTFANALRSLVRQDPDVLLIGEIRDHETANIAIESALTGHLVLSTLHTNDAPGAISRLRDLGIESFLMADSLLGIMAQRLVRVLCPHCKESYPARDVDIVRLKEVIEDLPPSPTLYHNKGCDKCGYTGFRGRQGIFELLPITELIRSAIVAGKSAGHISQLAFQQSYRPLLYHGYRKALDGVTTLSEVLRVTSLS